MLLTDAETWIELERGDTLTFLDAESLEQNSKGIKGKVLQTETFIEAEYGIGVLVETNCELSLFVRILADNTVLLATMYIPTDFMSGTREDVLRAGQDWLFEDPDDPEEFLASDLEYANEIENEDDEGTHSVFKRGSVTKFANRDVPAIIAMWESEGADNPLALAIETGGVTADGDPMPNGGIVRFFQGVPINEEQLTLAVKPA